MKKQILFIAYLATILIFPAQVFALNLGAAEGYNAFIFGDFSSNSDTEGRLAVGGNVALQGYSVGDRLSEDEKAAHPDTLIVGGDLNFTNGTVYGNAIVGGNANLGGVDVKGTLEEGRAPIDFEKEAAALREESLKLSTFAATGTVESQYGSLNLSGTGTSDTQIFNLDGQMLLDAHTFGLKNIADDATVIVNVSGKFSGFKEMGMAALAGFSDKVLFNFFEAEDLMIQNMGIEGSILAPLAHVNANNGQLEGTMIAASVDGSMEYHHQSFVGGGTPVPEPSTLLLLAVGVLGLFGAKRRLHK